jgi:hypothetical protein
MRLCMEGMSSFTSWKITVRKWKKDINEMEVGE